MPNLKTYKQPLLHFRLNMPHEKQPPCDEHKLYTQAHHKPKPHCKLSNALQLMHLLLLTQKAADNAKLFFVALSPEK